MFLAEGRIFKAACIDKKCQAVLFINHTERIIECYHCGQKFSKDLLQDVQEVPKTDKGAYYSIIRRMIHSKIAPKRGTEMVKVFGLSNYYCKLLSPLLTRYGMDKNTGRAKLLTDMNQGEIFDCSLFGDRAFLIEPEHISIAGFGKDITGSLGYLAETLKIIVASNEGEERLLPIHADGDGHCLVHAISRALVGRELFWHPLRCCLKKHFNTNIDKYKELFKDFIDTDEWACIIEECDPNFQPPEGELHGLRNIHIFGLANVLRRPIILLDSLDCMQKCGDYSALFLPGFESPEVCRGKDNSLNKPLCIAWSSPGHNHYIPLVGIQKFPLPVLPSALIPKVWGMPQSQIFNYIEFDVNNNIVIGGNRVLSNAYIQRLVHAMEVLFYETNGIHPTLVADYKLYYCADNLLYSPKLSTIVERAKAVAQECRFYRCLYCKALNEFWLKKQLFTDTAEVNRVIQNLQKGHREIKDGFYLKYDKIKSEIIIDWSRSEMQSCEFCSSTNIRRVTSDGTVIFRAEDKDNPERGMWFCDQARRFYPEEDFESETCKKTFEPQKLSLKLQWKNKEVEDEFVCFHITHNNRENLNEFVQELSCKLTKKHFPDEASDYALQAHVTEEIWNVLRKSGLCLPFRPITKKPETIIEKTENALSSDIPLKLPPSELRYVKVVTSNGQQANYALTEEGVSYGQLQEWIKNEFNIPVSSQRIKLGFPPKEVQPSGDTNKQILSLSHGDRLTVEVRQEELNIIASGNSNKTMVPLSSDNKVVIETPQEEERIAYLLNRFTVEKNSQKENIEPLGFTKFQNEILWNVIKITPENFRKNGTIYKQICEDNLLHKTMHMNLESFPEKVFCYNTCKDSIELCVKPLGHFMISSDIDLRIEDVRNGKSVMGFSKCPLLAKLEGMSDSHTFRRTTASQNSEEIQRRPLLRKGPGFSVLTSPEDMDMS